MLKINIDYQSKRKIYGIWAIFFFIIIFLYVMGNFGYYYCQLFY